MAHTHPVVENISPANSGCQPLTVQQDVESIQLQPLRHGIQDSYRICIVCAMAEKYPQPGHDECIPYLCRCYLPAPGAIPNLCSP